MNTQTLKRFWAATCAAALLAADPGLLAAAATLEGVEVGKDEVTVYLSEKVKFNAFTTSEPARLVLELLDTEHVASSEYTPGNGKYLTRVRSGQYQREPDLISRVVLYLSGLVSYNASWEGSNLKIGLVASDLPRKAAEVAAAVAAPVAAPAEAAVNLENEIITFDRVDVDATGVTVRLSAKTKFNAFTTEDPARLVIDLFDTEYVGPSEYLPGKGDYLKRVRAAQFQQDPKMVSRVVIYLSEMVSYNAGWDGADLKIGLVTDGLTKKAAAAIAAVAAPAAVPVEAAEVAPSDVISLKKVDVDETGVTIRMNRKGKFTAFTTEDPARLVIELPDTRHATTSDYIPGKGSMIRRVRSGQFQPEPNLTSRVVLYLNDVVSYGASWKGGDLRVTLLKSAEKRPPAEKKPMVLRPKSSMATAPVVAAVPVPTIPDVADDAPPPPPVVDEEDESAPPAAASFDEEPEPEPAPKSKRRPKADMPSKMTTSASSELEQIARAKDYDRMDEVSGREEAKKIVGDPIKKAATKVRRDIIGTLPTDPVTLDFDDMDVRDVLKLLATKAQINLVYGSEVSGTMTLHLKEVPFNEAFMTALSMESLIPIQVGTNILRVVTPESLAQQRAAGINQTKVIPLRYADGAILMNSIKAVRTAEQRTGGLVHDLKSNSLIITDSLEGIASLERMLADLDVRPQQVLIEVKLVEVTLTKDLHFGIQWNYYSDDRGSLFGQKGRNIIGSGIAPADDPFSKPFDQGTLGVTATPPAGATGAGTGVNLPAGAVNGAFTLGRVTNNYFLNATITAAANQGKAKVLSDPKLTTLDGEKANINITTQIPYVTSNVASTGVTTQAVSYVTTGITMAVTPTIQADGRVHLEVNPSVSQPSATAAAAGTTGAPSIDSRTAQTKVMVRDGETIVIGGLITDQVNDTVSKVPLLGDIPLLGWFFKKKSKTRTRVELLIFVTTRIVAT